MTQSKSRKFRKSRLKKLQSVFTYTRNWPYWSPHRDTVPIEICAGYSTLLNTAPCRSIQWGLFNCVVGLLYMTMLLSNYPRVIFFFICNVLICVIFINRCQTWTIYGLWTEVPTITILTIIISNNYQIWNYDHLNKCGLFLFRCVYMYIPKLGIHLTSQMFGTSYAKYREKIGVIAAEVQPKFCYFSKSWICMTMPKYGKARLLLSAVFLKWALSV